MGAEHPGLSRDIDVILAQNEVVATRPHARLVLAEQLLSGVDLDSAPSAGTPAPGALPSLFAGICVDKSGLLSRAAATDTTQTISAEMKHLCDAWRASTEAALQTSLFAYALNKQGRIRPDGGTPPPDPAPSPEPDPAPRPLPDPAPFPDPTPRPDPPPRPRRRRTACMTSSPRTSRRLESGNKSRAA